jgi:hypothetical protein
MNNRVFFTLLVVLFGTIYGMFTIKYSSRAKLKELEKIEKMISQEENRIALLQVDLEHVTRPETIRKMLYLLPHLQPIKPNQVVVVEGK